MLESGSLSIMRGGEPHFPYARPLRLRWEQTADGCWHYANQDPRRWEVVCAQCGDTDGPAEGQPEPARSLRGPYDSKHAAHRAAKHHAKEHPGDEVGFGPMSNWPVI